MDLIRAETNPLVNHPAFPKAAPDYICLSCGGDLFEGCGMDHLCCKFKFCSKCPRIVCGVCMDNKSPIAKAFFFADTGNVDICRPCCFRMAGGGKNLLQNKVTDAEFNQRHYIYECVSCKNKLDPADAEALHMNYCDVCHVSQCNACIEEDREYKRFYRACKTRCINCIEKRGVRKDLVQELVYAKWKKEYKQKMAVKWGLHTSETMEVAKKKDGTRSRVIVRQFKAKRTTVKPVHRRRWQTA